MFKKWVLLLGLALLAGQVVYAQDTTACGDDTEEKFVERGDFKLDGEDWEGAIAEYTCAIQLNPSNTVALFNRGYSYYKLGEYTEAEADYNAELELNPTDGATYNNRGNIYYARGDYEHALQDYDRAIELATGEVYISYYNRAGLKLETGDYNAALADIAQALKVNPDYQDSYLVRARIYQTMGDPRADDDYARWVESIQKETEAVDFSGAIDDQTYAMAEGLVYEVQISASAGQVIQAAARTNADSQVDTLLLLENADQKPVAGDDDSGVNLDAVLSYTVPADGTYSLLVTHSNGGSEGEVKLTVTLGGEAATGNAADVFTDYRLAVDEKAVVYTTEGDRLNLRSGPGLTFDILDKLSRDTVVTLIEGPRRADGLAWWRVQTADGLEGWAVERVDNEQTLQLALVVGGKAVVTSTEGDTLRVRGGAGRSFEVIAQLEPGTIVTLLEGPQIVDDLSWWKIQTEDGLEGWAVERVENDRTLTRRQEAEG
ncbi:MAG: tetratricopeptide repeat protein [Anaerolineae bacterium]|nr:tetratricopeptide repeat protein [Anaerolineae bacterium]